jgi:hypothetical protein
VLHQVRQAEGFHESDDAIQKRIQHPSITPDDGYPDDGALIDILVPDLGYGNVEAMTAFVNDTFNHSPLLFEGLISVEPENNPYDSYCHDL